VDGYCLTCGAKAKTLREHYEMAPSDWVAGVCDIGRVHPHNEDSLDCKALDGRAILVVCDGVTTSYGSDVASMAAARTACEFLWMSTPQGLGTPESREAAVSATLKEAVARANEAVIATTDPSAPGSAAATIAIGLVEGMDIVAASLGDSRVYWLPDSGEPVLVTKDHSLAQAAIDSGTARAAAESAAFAHTITKWLGADAQDIDPYIASLVAGSPGWLIVCSDGLWNYASTAAALARVVFAEPSSTPIQLADRLVAWANEKGGHDNITVACARVIPPEEVPAAEESSEEIPKEVAPDDSAPERDTTVLRPKSVPTDETEQRDDETEQRDDVTRPDIPVTPGPASQTTLTTE
jgi:serine/threonine protein phosphatase PrpC